MSTDSRNNLVKCEKITLAFNRIPATGTQTLGSLLVNPGGPGGSGIDLVKEISEAPVIPDQIRSAYDIVDFVPRGIGKRAPVDCAEFGIDDYDVYPPTAEDIAQMVAQTTASFCHS